jgi:hypothetical protein
LADNQWIVDGLPLDNEWDPSCGCAKPSDRTSTVDNIQITGSPGGVTSVQNDQALWAVILNDGTPQADFAIQRFNSGQLVDTPMTIERATGIVTFHDPVMLSEDPVDPMEAVTKEYVDTKGGVLTWNARAGDVTMTSTDVMTAQGYSSYDAANPAGYQTQQQVTDAINFAVPQPSNNFPLMDGTAAPGQTNQWARSDHVHPTDTSRYAASNPSGFQTSAQVTASLSNYLPLAGGTLTGNLFVPTLVATTGIAGTSGGAPPVLFTDPPAADSSLMVPSTRWVQARIASFGSSVSISDTPPASPKVGDLWWDSVGGQLYVWYADANSSQWVVANNGGAPPTIDTHYRNRIINGDMAVDIRNGGALIAMPAAGGYIIDRWKFLSNIASKGQAGRVAIAAPSILPFPYSLQFITQTAYASPAAGDVARCAQLIEGINFNDAQWGTALAQPVTLEFWANAGLAGTYSVAATNVALNRSYVSTFTLPAGNWTKIKLNIPGDQSGTWAVADAAAALSLSFALCIGSTYQTATLNQWQAGAFLAATGATNVFASTSNYLALSGVALMVGAAASNAEPEFRKFSDNLIDCQRYYQKYVQVMASGYNAAGANVLVQFLLSPQMRASPTSGFGAPAYANASGLAVNEVNLDNLRLQATITAVGYGYGVASPLTLDADF